MTRAPNSPTDPKADLETAAATIEVIAIIMGRLASAQISTAAEIDGTVVDWLAGHLVDACDLVNAAAESIGRRA